MADTTEDRKKKFYTKQREDAEAAADKGDRSAAGKASKIYGKLGDKEKSTYYGEEKLAGKGFAKASSGLRKVSDVAGKAAAAIGGGPESSIAGKAASAVASKFPAASRLGEAVSGLAKKAIKSGKTLFKNDNSSGVAAGAAKKVASKAKTVASKAKSAAYKVAPKVQKAAKDVGKPGVVTAAAEKISKAAKKPKAKPAAPNPRAGKAPKKKSDKEED